MGSFECEMNSNIVNKHFQVHRLVVVDKDDHVVGVMSLSDLLQVLVLHPPGTFTRTSFSS